jgi:uncharacterized protein (TIGR02996 family)
MSAPNPFLAEVVDHPEDDVARLVYADWLDEHGDARGSFIRAQCELASLSETDAAYHDALQAQEQLLAQFRPQWVAELQQDLKKSAFRRGFIEDVTLLASSLVKDNGHLLELAPIHWLRLNRVKGKGPALAALPAMSRLRGLDISGLVIPPEDLLAIFNSPHLTNLVRFRCKNYNSELDEDIAKGIVDSGLHQRLQHLDLKLADALQTLFTVEFPELVELILERLDFHSDYKTLTYIHAPKLKRLSFKQVALKANEFAKLSVPWQSMESLQIETELWDPGTMSALGALGAFDGLQELTLRFPVIACQELHHLFDNSRLSQCRVLKLGNSKYPFEDRNDTSLGSEAVPLIANSDQLAHLRELSISNLAAGQLAALVARPMRLQRLELHQSTISRADVALANSPLRESLRWIGFSGSEFAPGVAEELANVEFPNVLCVDFGSSFDVDSVNPSDVQLILARGKFPELRLLRLDWLRTSSELLHAIGKNSFSELRFISFQNNHCSQTKLQQFLDEQQLPKLYQIWMYGTIRTKNLEKFMAKNGNRVKLELQA